jgi:uncharacterized protein YecT (DUF1311 family)
VGNSNAAIVLLGRNKLRRIIMSRFLFIILSTCLLFTTYAFGIECGDLKTQLEMNECAKNEYEKRDHKLNELYNLVVSKLDKEDRDKLKNVEKAWIKYRDLHCKAATDDNVGGSIYYFSKFQCLKALTDQRVKSIEIAYQQYLRK